MAAVAMRDACHESIAFTIAVNEPNVVGMPAIVPVAASIATPAGSAPEMIDHTTPPTLPLAEGATANGWATIAATDAGTAMPKSGAFTISDSSRVVAFCV